MEETMDTRPVQTTESFKSRKLFVVVLGMLLMLIGAILTLKWALFGPHYSTFIGGITGLVTIYLIGNVSDRFLAGKVNASVQVAEINAPTKLAEVTQEGQ